MAGTHWIVEGNIDPRWPINTRGNIGEVFPERLVFSRKAISRALTP